MKKEIIFVLLILVLLGCTSPSSSTNTQNTDENNPMPGSDRDSHGCIPSAGYSWCEEKQKCLRTWEEPCTLDSSSTDKNAPANELKKAPATMQTVLDDLSSALNEIENLNKGLQK